MTIEAYFSHSWQPADVELNIFVWKVIAPYCHLYVDYEGADTKTYYINRLEELIRKSDVFVSLLAYREKGAGEKRESKDYQLFCSPGSLFELRLAERARKPRWIIYDDRTGFSPIQTASDLVVYTPVDTEEELRRSGRSIQQEGERWIERMRGKFNPSGVVRSRQAALLIDDTRADAKETAATVTLALQGAGYSHITSIDIAHTDAEVIAILQSSGLLVAEIGTVSVGDIYGMAHAMFIPTIRFIRGDHSAEYLPRLLDGHPGGYQHDLLLADDKESLAIEVGKRARAMRDQRRPIDNFAAGCAYLRRRLFRKHNVFFSHNLRPEDGDLLQFIFDMLQEKGIQAWEYRHNNRAGVIWKDELQSALTDATDVVFILDEGYELSSACSEELDTIMARRNDIQYMLPFFWGKRNLPNPKLSALHHDQLPVDKANAAQIVVERLALKLRMIETK